MSIQVIALILPKRLGSPARKIVAMKLADVAQDDGSRIYPSVETIAAQCELSQRQTQYVLKEFVQNGLLIVLRKGGGRNRPTHYRFDLEAVGKLPDAKVATDTFEHPKEGAEMSEPSSEHTSKPVIPQQENPALSAPFKGENPALTAPFKGERVHCTALKGALSAPNPSLSLSTSSAKKASAPDGAGGEPPSVNAEIWKEGLSLLKTTSLSDKQVRTILGQWCKRAPSEENKAALLAIIRAARRAGTGDPVSYIAKAVNSTFPAPVDPKTFDETTWHRNIQAAINMRSWAPAWGPPPGAKGCKVPPAMITRQLLDALQQKRRSAA